ncbi:MAG: aminoacyl-tRNA hydrolase [Ignavibacteria bacterium]|nr:aminoacyl-tRNA hydrolase [Ignavibacteria bacterium]
MKTALRDFSSEAEFTTSRSGGKGGQNVNKVETRVQIHFNVDGSSFLTDEEKQLLRSKLKSRISGDGFLIIASDEERSQYLNKLKAIGKLNDLLNRSLRKMKPRKKTSPTKGSVTERLQKKKLHSGKKNLRKKNFGDD